VPRPGLRALRAAALLVAAASGGASAAPPLAVERLGEGRVRVEARGAPRDAVLEALARAGGFRIEPGAGSPPAATLALELREASLEDALAQALAGVPYHLHYEPDEADGAVALRRVTVGLLPAAAPAADAPPERVRARRPPAPAPSEDERRARLAALRDARSEADREEAASLMRPDEDLPALLACLRDPGPGVRARAAASLGAVELGEDAFRATEGLLGLLGDADPAVVAAAVEALESVYDVLPHPRIRAGVARLASHPDAEVRDAAASFLEWAEEQP
jgi:hypothetical protein